MRVAVFGVDRNTGEWRGMVVVRPYEDGHELGLALHLDNHSAEAVMQLFTELHAGGTILCMVTHDAGLAARAQRVVTMLDGQIQETAARKVA